MTQVDILFERHGPKYRWLVATTVLLGLVALGMSITIVNVATPYISGAFGMSADQVQWLSTGFLAATTVTLLIAPWMVSAFGLRTTYISLLLVFIAASLLGGTATSMGGIVAARIIQGATTGLVRPVALEALFLVFPPEQRGMATALYGMSLGLPLTLATVVGGWTVETYTWHYVFFLVLPLCVAAIVLGYLFLPPREDSGPRPRLDWFGAVTLFIAIFALLTAVSNGQRWGWYSESVVGLVVFSVVMGGVFVAWERRLERPLLDLAMFRHLGFTMGALALFLFGGVFYAVMYLLPQFSQTVLQFSPVNAGMLFTPSTVVLFVLVPLVGKLSDRVPPHYLTMPGLAFAVYAMYRFAQVDSYTSFTYLAVSMTVLSLGMSAFPPPTMARAIASLPPRLIGYGSGTINFALQLGGAFATAGLVTMMDRRTAFHGEHLTATLNADNATAMHTLSQLQGVLAQVGTSATHQQAAASHLLGKMDSLSVSVLVYQDGFWAILVGVALVAIPSWILGRWSGWSGESAAGGR
ncbi:DHA2 family efflux MFS transporter permease subunit [Ectothiorhodospiraceae bacterium WFHF3C12]|nr:DHA2 family efflux MFS transporter permease subunit [Ectothiorhodospiraceae bacterium WFHF3C12]